MDELFEEAQDAMLPERDLKEIRIMVMLSDKLETFEWDAIEYRVEDFIERLMGWHQA